MRPSDLTVPMASETAVEKLAGLDKTLPEVTLPDHPDMPDDDALALADQATVPELPEAASPDFPDLSLPEQAHADIDIPNAHLPDFFFDDAM